MTQNEMIRNIAEKCGVSLEEARTALEAGEWNALTAAQTLESEKLRRMQEVEAVASSCATATAQAPADEPAADGENGTAEWVEAAGTAASTEAEAKAGRAEARRRDRGQVVRTLGGHIRRLVACGNRNRFAVRRNDATLLELPVTVAALLMLFAFWTCVPLLVIGLFMGCRYSFKGQDFEKAAAYIRKTAAET